MTADQPPEFVPLRHHQPAIPSFIFPSAKTDPDPVVKYQTFGHSLHPSRHFVTLSVAAVRRGRLLFV